MTETDPGALLPPRADADVSAWDGQADVVIVGHGCAGASAARRTCRADGTFFGRQAGQAAPRR